MFELYLNRKIGFLLKLKFKKHFGIAWYFDFIDCCLYAKYYHTLIQILKYIVYWLYLHKTKTCLGTFWKREFQWIECHISEELLFNYIKPNFYPAWGLFMLQVSFSAPRFFLCCYYELWKLCVSIRAQGCLKTSYS